MTRALRSARTCSSRWGHDAELHSTSGKRVMALDEDVIVLILISLTRHSETSGQPDTHLIALT